MVLPVPGGDGGGKKKGGGGGKRGKKGGKGKGGGGGDVQVNLIVDPHAFNFDPDHDDEDNIGESGDDDDGGMPGGFSPPKPRSKGRERHQRRRGVLARLAMEESWRHARRWAKKLAVVDVAGVVLWGGALCSFCWVRDVLVVHFRGGTSFSYCSSLLSLVGCVTLTDSPSFAWIQVLECIQRLLSCCMFFMHRFWS